MRREIRENLTPTYILHPNEMRSIRCRDALNRELKCNKMRKNCDMRIWEYVDNKYPLGYVYQFTSSLNDLTFDMVYTDDTGRLKEYISGGSKYRIKSHFIKAYLAKKRRYFTLCVNDMLFPWLSLDEIKLSDSHLNIYCNGFTCALINYDDIKRLQVI